MKYLKLVIMASLCVVAVAFCAYALVNVLYNQPEERYPDPLGPIAAEESMISDVAESAKSVLPYDTSEVVAETDFTEAVTAAVTEAVTEAVQPHMAVTLTENVSEPVPDAVMEEETGASSAFDAEAETVTVVAVDTGVLPQNSIDDGLVAEIAVEIMKSRVKEAADLVISAKIDGSFQSYHFEERDSRSGLTESQKNIYDVIKTAVSGLESLDFTDSDGVLFDTEDVKAAFESFAEDEPGMSYYVTLDGIDESDDKIPSLRYFLPSDPSVTVKEDKSALIHDIAVFEAVVDFIVDSMPEELCTYDKYRYLASVVSLCTVYDHNHDSPLLHETAYGSIMTGLSVCTGYTVGFEYLCRRADLYCERAWGATYHGLVHMWNLVKLDTGTYHVDVTWSDNDKNTPCSRNWQTYFMLTQERLLDDHVISDGTTATGTEIFY